MNEKILRDWDHADQYLKDNLNNVDGNLNGIVSDVEHIKGTADGQFIYDTEAKMTKIVPENVNKGIVAMIGGKTIKYNQLSYNNAKSSEQPSYNIYWYNLGDGLFQAKGTPTTNVVFPLNSGDVVNTTFKANHKYYLMGAKDGSETSYHICIWESSIGYLAYDYGDGAIFNPNKDYIAQFRLRVVSGYDLGTNGVTFKPRLIDLTVMFGSGNEPTTVDDERIIALRTYAEDNPEQTDGELWNAPVEKVVLRGANIIDSTLKSTLILSNGQIVTNTAYNTNVVPVEIGKKYNISKGADNLVYAFFTSYPGLNSVSYNGSRTVVEVAPSHSVVVAPITGWMVFRTQAVYNKSSCAYGEIARRYTPPNKSTFSLERIIDSLPDYGCSVGDVYNYIDFEEMVYHHKVKKIKFGDMGFAIHDASSVITTKYFRSSDIPYAKAGFANSISAKYEHGNTRTYLNSNDKSYSSYNDGTTYIVVRDDSYSSYATESEFNKANVNTEFVYELAQEELIPLTDLLLPFKCEQGGTVTFENEHNLGVPNTIIYEKEMK